MPLAVKACEVATPEAFVVAVFMPPAKLTLGPEAGGVNVTTTPLTGLLPASDTSTTNGAPNAVFTFALCGVPLTTLTVAGAPTVFVSTKFAGPVPPGTVAVTV